MLTMFHWVSIFSILLITIGGGFLPLFRQDRARAAQGFPMGQAFASGVFLALSLTIMLPNGFHLFAKTFPAVSYPLASLFAIMAYLFLLALGHLATATKHMDEDKLAVTTPVVPIIMTIMIAIPSFFLGTALGVSDYESGLIILFAILAHKGTAGFALALSMVRSTLKRPQVLVLFCLFACSTPLGILVGADVHDYLSGHTMMIFKAVILSLASGVFLFMATLHEMKHSPMIVDCCTKKGFIALLFGFIITALVRLLIGIAHTGHTG